MASQRLSRLVSDKALPDLKKLSADPELTLAVIKGSLVAKASLLSSVLTESVSSSTGRGVTEVVPLVQTIRQLARVQHSLEASAETFVAELAANLAEMSEAEWSKEDRERWRAIASELIQVLSPGSPVYLSVKAHDLLMEQALALCSAQIVTDVRPIFNDEASELEGVIPFHTLILRCHPNGDPKAHETIRVAIDATDLRDIRSQLDRAERKEQIMRKQLDSNGYNIVNMSDEMGAE